MATFEQIGQTVPVGEVAITNDDADTFRRIAKLGGLRLRKIDFNTQRSEVMTTSYASGVLSTAAGVEEDMSRITQRQRIVQSRK